MYCTFINNKRITVSDVQKVIYGMFRSFIAKEPLHIFIVDHNEELDELLGRFKSDVIIHTMVYRKDNKCDYINIDREKLEKYLKKRVVPGKYVRDILYRQNIFYPSVDNSSESIIKNNIDRCMNKPCLVVCDTSSDLPYLYSQSEKSKKVGCYMIRSDDRRIIINNTNFKFIAFTMIIDSEMYRTVDMNAYSNLFLDIIENKTNVPVNLSNTQFDKITFPKHLIMALSVIKESQTKLKNPYTAPEIAEQSWYDMKESRGFLEYVIDNMMH